ADPKGGTMGCDQSMEAMVPRPPQDVGKAKRKVAAPGKTLLTSVSDSPKASRGLEFVAPTAGFTERQPNMSKTVSRIPKQEVDELSEIPTPKSILRSKSLPQEKGSGSLRPLPEDGETEGFHPVVTYRSRRRRVTFGQANVREFRVQ
ncbi:unnamed protein product, partial [Polarella glacialis]